jgi:hypothetical protein
MNNITQVPRILTILGKDGKAYKGKIGVVRVSEDGVFIGVCLQDDRSI